MIEISCRTGAGGQGGVLGGVCVAREERTGNKEDLWGGGGAGERAVALMND